MGTGLYEACGKSLVAPLMEAFVLVAPERAVQSRWQLLARRARKAAPGLREERTEMKHRVVQRKNLWLLFTVLFVMLIPIVSAAADYWKPPTNPGPPTARWDHTAVWTGT